MMKRKKRSTTPARLFPRAGRFPGKLLFFKTRPPRGPCCCLPVVFFACKRPAHLETRVIGRERVRRQSSARPRGEGCQSGTSRGRARSQRVEAATVAERGAVSDETNIGTGWDAGGPGPGRETEHGRRVLFSTCRRVRGSSLTYLRTGGGGGDCIDRDCTQKMTVYSRNKCRRSSLRSLSSLSPIRLTAWAPRPSCQPSPCPAAGAAGSCRLGSWG